MWWKFSAIYRAQMLLFDKSYNSNENTLTTQIQI